VRVRLAPLAAALVLLAGCGSADEPRDGDGLVTVGDVAIDVPDGWERIEDEPGPALVANTRFVDPDQRVRLLQVIVGCDERGVDALVDAVGQPRAGFLVTGAFEAATPPDVEGLDRARRVTLELEPATEETTTGGDAVIEAIYGEAGATVLLVELSVPAVEEDLDVEAVLASLVVDGGSLAGRCTDEA
jgi:hypothetical protein